jgi:hypothetical protein
VLLLLILEYVVIPMVGRKSGIVLASIRYFFRVLVGKQKSHLSLKKFCSHFFSDYFVEKSYRLLEEMLQSEVGFAQETNHNLIHSY